MPEFATWRAFENFEREVRRKQRFVRSSSAENFLDAVRRTCGSRSVTLKKGFGFWRAQQGHGWRRLEEIDDDVPAPHDARRMKPLADRAVEGRANPHGVPVLYLATTRQAAMSEVRPWLGAYVSVGHFEAQRDLRLIDCSKYHGKEFYYFLNEPPPDKVDIAVWSHIDRAFSRPVTRSDDTAEYVATQILAEQFRASGFDGIAYKSAFGRQAFNIALFDLESAKLTYCELHEATQVRVVFKERADPYWVVTKRGAQPGRKKAAKRKRA